MVRVYNNKSLRLRPIIYIVLMYLVYCNSIMYNSSVSMIDCMATPFGDTGTSHLDLWTCEPCKWHEATYIQTMMLYNRDKNVTGTSQYCRHHAEINPRDNDTREGQCIHQRHQGHLRHCRCQKNQLIRLKTHAPCISLQTSAGYLLHSIKTPA